MAEKTRVEIYVDDQQAVDKLKELANTADKFVQKMEECRRANDKAGFDKAEKEYKATTKEMNSYKKSVVDVTAVLNNLSGVSYNNLIKAQRSLRSEISGMSRNTKEEIALYNQKIAALKQVDGQIKTVRSEMNQHREGSNKLMNSFRQLLPVMGLGAGLAGAFAFLKSAVQSTGKTADDFEKVMGGVSEATNYLKRSLITLDFSNLIQGFKDAYKEGKRYAETLDYIEDLQRALNIQKVDLEIEISHQRAIAKNRLLDLDQRKAAVEEIVRLEEVKLTSNQKVTDQTLENELKSVLAIDKTQRFTKEMILDFISNYDKYSDKIKEGIRLKEELDKVSQDFEPDPNTGYGVWYKNAEKYEQAYNKLTKEQKESIDISNLENLVLDEKRDKLSQAIVGTKNSVLELANSEEALIKIRNSLYKELINDDEDDISNDIIKAVENLREAVNEISSMQPLNEDGLPVVPGFPSEIELRDRGDKMLEILSDSSKTQQEVLKEMLDQNLISYEEYYQSLKDLSEKNAWDNMDTQQKILYVSQGVLSSLQNLNNARAKSFESAMNRELKAATGNEAKQEAIRKEYAKKQNDLAVKQAYIAGALAIMQVWAAQGTGNFLVDAILNGLATIAMVAVTLEEVNLIKSNTYGEGNYADIIGSGDGKRYRAKIADSKHPSGLYSEPTYVPGFGLFGETPRPELVFNPADTSKIINTPGLVDAIQYTLSQRQFAQGNTREIIRESRTETFTDPALLTILNRIDKKLSEPSKAVLVANEDYIDTHKKVIADHDRFLNKVNAG